ncbi:MAG: FAD-binding protein [Planctomycetaceae bacterium]|nr:FAD-binding protein [Planctomycetaceae bacterium]
MTTLDEQHSRISEQIREDLAGQLAGEVRGDPGVLALYATDASLHQVLPLAVAFPRSTADVAAIVRYAADNQHPVIARGAGTGLAGGCLGAGIVVDFSRHMNRILDIREHTVVVQPGVVLDDLNRALKPMGRCFAADPSNATITTLGGMIGVDAAGSHALRVGSTRDHLRRLQVVLSDGGSHWLGNEPMLAGLSGGSLAAHEEDHDQYARVRVILRRLATILKEHEDLIREYQPSLPRNCAGYMLRGVLQRGYLNFPRLFAGSEGTLGLCTEAELHTSPLPAARGVALLLFSRFDQAIQALPGILEFEPSACDLLDRRLLTLARESSLTHDVRIPPQAEAALLVEFVDVQQHALEITLERFRRFVVHDLQSANLAQLTSTEEEARRLWQLPRQVIPLLARIKGSARPIPIIEDIVVPPRGMSDFLHQAQRVFQRYRVTASLYAHAGSGQLHLRPFLEMPSTETKGVYEALSRDIYRVVLDHGGSISGEHGDGFSRTAFIRQQYGPLYRVFQQVKQLFDPRNILNPEKIVSSDPHLTIRHMRPDAELVELQLTDEPQLLWQASEMAESARHCNGCGQCKSVPGPGRGRMCPFTRDLACEFYSPRAKANAIRNYLIDRFLSASAVAPAGPGDRAVQENLDSCFNCKQCHLECPSQVDIPHLWLEAKAADVQQNGLQRVDWVLSHIGRIANLAWRFSWGVNLLFRTRWGRWLLEQTCGIDARRRLPPLARRPYLEQVRIRNKRKKIPEVTTAGSNSGAKPVVLFLDYYSNFHDPQIAEALESILRHHGIPYVVPLEQEVSGMTLVNAGDLAAAREIAEVNLRVLGPYAREGHPILCVEPWSAVCLSQEYPLLIQHPDVQSLADHVWEAGAFLLQLHDQGTFRTDFSRLQATIGYHEPCHQRALPGRNPYHELLPLIPGLTLHPLDKGCSGMAGTFGLSRKNHERSLKIGAPLLDAVVAENFSVAASECSACRLQMEHPGAKPVTHPLKLIAAAYGLIPAPIETETVQFEQPNT